MSSDFPVNAMVLAAGLGTRFRPHTDKIPKPAIPFLNIPFVYYAIHLAEKQNAKRISINVHHLPQVLKQCLYDCPSPKAEFRIMEEKETLLGSGGGILNARNELINTENLLCINADTVCIPKEDGAFDNFCSDHEDNGALATLLTMEHPNAGTKFGGIWVNKDNEIISIGKQAPADKSLRCLHYTGIQWLSQRIFRFIPEQKPNDIFLDVLLPAIKKGEKVKVHTINCHWWEGGSLEQYLSDTKDALTHLDELSNNKYFMSLLRRFWSEVDARPSIWMGQGCTALSGLPANVLLGDACKISGKAKIDGFAVIASNIKVVDDVSLENVVLTKGVKLTPGQQLKNDLIFA